MSVAEEMQEWEQASSVDAVADALDEARIAILARNLGLSEEASRAIYFAEMAECKPERVRNHPRWFMAMHGLKVQEFAGGAGL